MHTQYCNREMKSTTLFLKWICVLILCWDTDAFRTPSADSTFVSIFSRPSPVVAYQDRLITIGYQTAHTQPPLSRRRKRRRFQTQLQESPKKEREQTQYLKKRQPGPVEGVLESIIPPTVPILAFFYYDVVVEKFQYGIKMIARNTWLNDGSKEPSIISALNSIVIPTSAILYATLTATTINALRQRQQKIREGLNQEASELKILQGLLEYIPEDRQDRFRYYLVLYISRVIDESQQRINLPNLESRGVDSEISELLKELNSMVAKDPKEERTTDILIFQAYDSLVRLKNARANRLSSMQDRLPILHYIVLFSLAFSITLGFLIETNKAKVDFDAFQLRILWTQLVASFSALGVVLYDLNFVFGGNYQVSHGELLQTLTNISKNH